MKVYNKLVRDRIPEIIAAQGRTCDVRTLDPQEYLDALTQKLGEELAEYRESGEMAELADLLEVIYALAAARGTSPDELEAIRRQKQAERGGFDRRLFLRKVND